MNKRSLARVIQLQRLEHVTVLGRRSRLRFQDRLSQLAISKLVSPPVELLFCCSVRTKGWVLWLRLNSVKVETWHYQYRDRLRRWIAIGSRCRAATPMVVASRRLAFVDAYELRDVSVHAFWPVQRSRVGAAGAKGFSMKIHAGYEISYECPQPTPMILMLSVHPSRFPDLLTEDRMRLDRRSPATRITTASAISVM